MQATLRNHGHILLFVLATAAGCRGGRPGLSPGSEPGSLGQDCSRSIECLSDYCASAPTGGAQACSRCLLTTDCPTAGDVCAWDSALGYANCTYQPVVPRPLGYACGIDRGCVSGFCFTAGAVCSQCGDRDDCGNNQDCILESALGYAVCAGVALLGQDCVQSSECVSGYCNGARCSQCDGPEACTAGGSCVDDRAGLGWFTCEGGVGDGCSGASDCGLGFCFDTGTQQICSECAQTGADCDTNRECLLDADQGWATCQGIAPLGATCAADDECASEICNSLRCSDCKGDDDCSGTCVDDTAGSGWFVCTTALGDPCEDATQCLSGFCLDAPVVGKVCSECDDQGDCGDLRDCVYSPTTGHGTCFGVGRLADSCTGDSQCLSGVCNNQICSECVDTADCFNGGTCLDDTGDVGYWVCERALGETCDAGSQCASGLCFDAGGIDFCSECQAGTCAGLQSCEMSIESRYASCVGSLALGADCTVSDDCASGSCKDLLCSLCEVASDCPGDGSCIDDIGGSGYWICERGLGDSCRGGGDCNSGACFDPGGGPQNDICSSCETNADCGAQRDCMLSPSLEYAVCIGTLLLAAPCTNDGQCEPGTFCNIDTCSECDGDGDCDSGETCADDRLGAGWFICLGDPAPLASECASALQCASGHCFDTVAGADRCSMCTLDGDCSAGACAFQFGRTFAVCEGGTALGNSCSLNGDCDSGFCANQICSQCVEDEHCGVGGACADDSASSGHWICLDGVGSSCASGDECASGSCYALGLGLGACSACEDGSDCKADQRCTYTISRGYALCLGIKDLGDSCQSATECTSGFCNGMKCSECVSASDCGEGGQCVDEISKTGWFVCTGGLGDPCASATECGSGHCYLEGFTFQRVCSECSTSADCTGDCDYGLTERYATCP